MSEWLTHTQTHTHTKPPGKPHALKCFDVPIGCHFWVLTSETDSTLLLLENVVTTLAILWRRKWQPTPVLLPGKSHGQRSLVGYSPWGRLESDTTERLHFHFSLSCIGEGNGTLLQCSCLENPRDGGAWWAAVYGVARVGHNWSDLAAAAACYSEYAVKDCDMTQCWLKESPSSGKLCVMKTVLLEEWV